jgi:GT2 family glycosyltransferase
MITSLLDRQLYKNWIEENEPSEAELSTQSSEKFQYEPKISLVVPAFNTPKRYLEDMVGSVLRQTYPNWELCIADGSSKFSQRETLGEYSRKDNRIKIKLLDRNKGIAGNSNEAVSMATGDYIALLDHDDKLPPFALFAVVKAVNENLNADFLYSDEDKITKKGDQRLDPNFKPDWSPDMLRSYNYICHLSVFKKSLLDKTGYFRDGYEGSQDYDLILRATEKAECIFHIPSVLYHWRISNNSVSRNRSAKMYAYESAKRALREHLLRVGLEGDIRDGLSLGSYKIMYNLVTRPRISIIIPNKDQVGYLRRCITSIIDKTSYKDYEIVIIENNSQEQDIFDYYNYISKSGNIKVIEWNNPFNYAALNNFAAGHAEGDILLFLNNDTEIINHDWLQRMSEHALRKEVGAVGAKLYFGDDTVQHGGVIVGMGGVAGHPHKHFPKTSNGYFGRLEIVQNMSAVTGACLMMRKDVFNEVGGLDEGFTHAFNDVDLCMKIRQRGYLIVWTPFAELYHYESKTRGYEDTPEKKERFKKEESLFRDKWGVILANGDPYYNPNLSLDNEHFSVRSTSILSQLRSRGTFRFLEYKFRKKIRDPIKKAIKSMLA